MASKVIPTIDRSDQNVDRKSGFLGPLYTEPTQNLGPYPVDDGSPKRPLAKDPIGLKHVDTGTGKKKMSK